MWLIEVAFQKLTNEGICVRDISCWWDNNVQCVCSLNLFLSFFCCILIVVNVRIVTFADACGPLGANFVCCTHSGLHFAFIRCSAWVLIHVHSCHHIFVSMRSVVLFSSHGAVLLLISIIIPSLGLSSSPRCFRELCERILQYNLLLYQSEE